MKANRTVKQIILIQYYSLDLAWTEQSSFYNGFFFKAGGVFYFVCLFFEEGIEH